jgi:hypothetical protein
MICTNCKHEKVCKFIPDMETSAKMIDEINSMPNPLHCHPECDMFDEMDTVIRTEKGTW